MMTTTPMLATERDDTRQRRLATTTTTISLKKKPDDERPVNKGEVRRAGDLMADRSYERRRVGVSGVKEDRGDVGEGGGGARRRRQSPVF